MIVITIFRTSPEADLSYDNSQPADEKSYIIPEEPFVTNQDQDTCRNDFEELIKQRIHSTDFEIWDDEEASEVSMDLEYTTNYDSAWSVDIDNQSKPFIMVYWIVLFLSLWAMHFTINATALENLLHFIKAFFQLCGKSTPLFSSLAFLLPSSIYKLYQIQNTKKDNFIKYVVCPACFSIYHYEDSYEMKHGKKVSKKCTFVEFPNHTHRSRQNECAHLLLKEVQCKDDTKKLYPYKVYCYRSIENSLKTFLDRPGFVEKCVAWRSRPYIPGYFRDVYDGRIWRQFMEYPHVDNTPYLQKRNGYGLILNVDYFQPFTHSPYSVGAIYCAILNLPREERYKQENILLLGVIPGPKEPDSHQIGKILKPMVDELKILWSPGFEYIPNTCPKELQKFYCCLMSISCDIPAARKVSGFLSHNARMGCSKCKKEFKCGE